MNSLTMSENGTITGSVKVGDDGDSSQTPTLSTITLSDNSGINAIVLGNNGARATINSLTLNNNSSIGTITNNSNATIVNLTLNETSTITNGITNAANGNIGTIVSNTGTNINNIITNHGTIGSLEVNNQGTIVYKSDNGIITDALSVASGATLDIKDSTGSNTGTIELKSDSAILEDGSTLNLANGSTLVGHLKNSGNLGDWTNKSKMQEIFKSI